MKVIVTAAAGDLGQAVIKALRLGTGSYCIIGTDIQESMIARHTSDEFHLIPPASEKQQYIKTLEELAETVGAMAVIPCSEIEIGTLHSFGKYPRLESGAQVICQSPEVVELFGDKLKCYEFLNEHVDLAAFADGKDRVAVSNFIGRYGYPVFIKERFSSGSKGVKQINSEEELIQNQEAFDSPVIQDYLEGDDFEYSVGVFKKNNDVRVVSYRRYLGALGCSWKAELDMNQQVVDYSKSISNVISFEGGINIQLRLTSSGPRLLEINTRFSSLCAARAACGFNDVEWSLLNLGRDCLPAMHALPSSFKFERYIGEVVSINDETSTSLEELIIHNSQQNRG